VPLPECHPLRRLPFSRYSPPEVIKRQLESITQRNLWLPAEQLSSARDIRASLFRVILRQWMERNLRRRSGHFEHQFRALQHRELGWVADIYRPDNIGICKLHDAIDFVGNVTEAARLGTVAIHGKIFPAKRLLHEIRNYAAIVKLKARTVSIENSYNSNINLEVAVECSDCRFGEPLRLIVNRPRADGIHVPPVSLGLWMHVRISVAL